MNNRTLARGISVIIWFVAALDIVHVLIPFLALLDSIDLTISNVHLTVLSLIEGGFLLVALFWLAKKISVFFEHWIKTVEHVTPSVQVLLHKLLTFALFTLVVMGSCTIWGSISRPWRFSAAPSAWASVSACRRFSPT